MADNVELRRLLGQLLKCEMGRVPHQGALSLVRILVRLRLSARRGRLVMILIDLYKV